MADWVGSPPLLFGGPKKAFSRQAVVSAQGAGGTNGAPNGLASANGEASVTNDIADGAEEELWSDDPIRNRQKELQDLVVLAEDPEPILSAVRELDGAIVISTALHRLGKVGNAADFASDMRFNLLLDKFKMRLPFFGARQISNSMHGLGAMLYRAGGDFIEMVNIQTQRRIVDFEPQHVSNTLWACARMQVREQLMLKALSARAVEDIGRMCPLDVSIITWAMATLKWRELDWFRTVVRSRQEFTDFSPQNMSNFVWGLATLHWRNDNMILAVGREAARKIQDFSPQELSNFSWALATIDLCDNMMLRAVAEEVDRRGDIVNTWDPQSLSNMMWAYATLAIKDDPLFLSLLKASVARMEDHDPQNLANSAWAAAMVSFRYTPWLDAMAERVVALISECQTLHLAQLAFSFVRCMYRGDRFGLMPALLKETLRRIDEFAPQSLFDVHDTLIYFQAVPRSLDPNPMETALKSEFEFISKHAEEFARQCARSPPTAACVAAYRDVVVQRDIVTIGSFWTVEFLRRFGLACPEEDKFVSDAKRQINDWRKAEAVKDPTSRSIFHRAQCAWQLGLHAGTASDGALADGVFESGEPRDGGPERHGLFVCRLRHPREGDAEVQALCAALKTSALKGGRAPPGLRLNLHLSDLPCLSCLGATLQFHFKFPGVLRVSFDRGRLVEKDTVPIPRQPPPPSRKGNSVPYAPMEPAPKTRPTEEGGNPVTGELVDRSMVRKEGPDCRDTTSFYRASGMPRRTNGAHAGGLEAVPHKKLTRGRGSSTQTYYFSTRPDYYDNTDYGEL